jgi:hypothetical protein
VVIFGVGSNRAELNEFRTVFGARYVGLVDSTGVYSRWRVPNPTAPYPQDYIVDQQGVVQYWSDQFDPQGVIKTIDRLLTTGVKERAPPEAIRMTPIATIVNGALRLPVASGISRSASSALLDIIGRKVLDLHPGPNDVSRLAPGVYFIWSAMSPTLPATTASLHSMTKLIIQ